MLNPIQWPNRIRMLRDSLYVADQAGIRILPLGGQTGTTIKSFYQINDFALTSKGEPLIVPGLPREEDTPAAIIALSLTGNKQRTFGRASTVKDFATLLNKGFLSVSQDSFVLGYRHRPAFLLGNLEGGVRELTIHHPNSGALARLDHDLAFIHPDRSQYRLSSYIAGMTSTHDRFYVLLDLPYIAIQEYDWSGSQLATYTLASLKPIRSYFGLEFDPTQADTFLIGVGYSLNEFAVLRLRKSGLGREGKKDIVSEIK